MPEGIVKLDRQPGFSLHALRPSAAPPSLQPPGQGRLFVVLHGLACLDLAGAATGRVLSTPRQADQLRLEAGDLARVPNDQGFSLRALAEGTRLLAVRTSVPRGGPARQGLLERGATLSSMAPAPIFENERLRVELIAARGRLPGRGWLPWAHRAPRAEYALVLQGRFQAELRVGGASWRGSLDRGLLLRLPAGSRSRLRATGRDRAIALLLSVREGPGQRAQGAFSPF